MAHSMKPTAIMHRKGATAGNIRWIWPGPLLNAVQHLVGDVKVGVDILDIVILIQSIQQFQDLLRSIGIVDRNGSFGNHGQFGVAVFDAFLIQVGLDTIVILRGRHYLDQAIILP